MLYESSKKEKIIDTALIILVVSLFIIWIVISAYKNGAITWH